jgi:hypothetical protein
MEKRKVVDEKHKHITEGINNGEGKRRRKVLRRK